MLILAAVLALTFYNFNQQLPATQWLAALHAADPDQVDQMVFHYSLMPRLVLSLLVGGGLGLVGVLFQQVLRNPLAEPGTLGVATGAQLGLTIATLWSLPGGPFSQQMAAMAGAIFVAMVVFGIAWGKRLSPVTLILAGLVMSLYCGAANQLLRLFNHDRLQNIFLWSTGTLNQMDWHNVSFLWLKLLIGLLLSLVMIRPMTLLGLDDGVAKNLGLSLALSRIGVLALAVVLSAQLVNAVGIISFIGLFAPLLAKMLGARRLPCRLLLATLIGMLLLWLADQGVIWLTARWRDVSTGTATAIIGAPLLLWLLPRLKMTAVIPAINQGDNVPLERHRVAIWASLAAVLLLVLGVAAVSLGRDAHGWHWATGELLQQLMPWRLPRMAAALTTGMMLGVAGCIVQGLTGNPMASPEVLGISTGAAFGVVVMLFIVPGYAFGWLLPAGCLGAALTLLVIATIGGRGGFSPERMLLAGMALSTVFSTLLLLLLASGDPRMATLMTWIAGSTYHVDAAGAGRTALITAILLGLTPLCRRWLMLLPLGSETARAVGLALRPARMALLLLAAALTAAATLTTGPLSFVGLMAPHIARMLGFRRALPQLIMAALLGGGLMTLADWCGRMIAFPAQIPAGLLATLIGAPYFVWLLRKVQA
ncbi:Fe(3+)-hydroxamate ABC transporter permease FhuB [Erwinia tracheiphila]|nr:Fe(3+)-hydroxamate ABC transporter permease FhuB [Erwinia tracheiphila]UIA90012.1 Fe(3+)-hydroxamate ABC transporter permease FhuB [Erwinia tracheiphila]UIA98539.1 Fe(3+)-hydroxamate ABC transporter permease FhuB [Erwinia tracheiphila]